MTCGVLSAGAGVCTVASVRAGFRPIWCTEVDEDAAAVWTNIFGGTCYGNTFEANWETIPWVAYMTSGQPCPDYARCGSRRGRFGKTGWMFVQQVEVILYMQPACIRLEISDYAWNINNGEEATYVIQQLESMYIVKHKLMHVWQYGDGSNRTRLFIVGFHKALGDMAHWFEFPQGDYNNDRWHCARDFASKDEDVPDEYWRYDTEYVRADGRLANKHYGSNKLIKIGQVGEGIGPASNPNGIYSWDGTFNSQSAHNGVGRRPRLDWCGKNGDLLGPTRLTCEDEAVRIASLPKWFGDTLHKQCPDPNFTFRSVNNGIPCRTSTAIDRAVYCVLTAARHAIGNISRGCRQDVRQTCFNMSKQFDACTRHISRAMFGNKRRSIMLDTGADTTLLHPEAEIYLRDSKRSRKSIQVANSETMKGRRDGTVRMITGSHTIEPTATTIKGLPQELLSFDNLYYEQGYSLIISTDDFTIPCYKCGMETSIGAPRLARNTNNGEESVPIRCDKHEGGFWIDYACETGGDDGYSAWDYDEGQSYAMAAIATKHPAVNSMRYGGEHDGNLIANGWSGDERDMMKACSAVMMSKIRNSMDTPGLVVAWGDEREPCNIKGVKSGLKPKLQKLTAAQFHEEYSHIGSCPGCKICRMTKGAMRKIFKVIDKHREFRRAHTYVMDTVTINVRSLCGCKYMIVIKCKATGYIHLIFLKWKSDSVTEVERWIKSLRSDPMFQNMGYPAVQLIQTDSAGEWSMDSEEWTDMQERMGFKTTWTCPDRKEEAGMAERTCGVVEVVLKAGLMQENLPPNWWVRTAKSGTWLLNRFGKLGINEVVPDDGDQCRPLELYTGFHYSRRQIDRELNYYVPVGRVALVHMVKVKGSQLTPKTRWGICIEMYREQVIWWSPYTKSTFRSKSFTAYKLRKGMNFMHFLKLPIEQGTQGRNTIHDDLQEAITITLPALDSVRAFDLIDATPPPIIGTQHKMADTGGAIHETCEHTNDDGELTDAPMALAPHHEIHDPDHGVGGSVCIKDAKGNTLCLDPETGDMLASTQAAPDTNNKHLITKTNATHSEKHGGDDPYVLIRNDENMTKMFDIAEANTLAGLSITTGVNDSFIQTCKRHDLPAQHHRLYKQWLIRTQMSNGNTPFTDADLPIDRSKLKPNMVMPKPSGYMWRHMIQHTKGMSNEDVDKMLVEQAINETLCEVKAQANNARKHNKICFVRNQDIYAFRAKAHKKKRQQKAVAGGQDEAPATTMKCLEGNRGRQWCDSINEEIDGLTKMGVVEHNFTKQQAKELGVTLECPIILAHTHKHNEEGEIDRLKSRAALQGDRRHMIKGVHFWETFTPTPREDTSRVLQAIMILMKWKRKAGDVKMAYCWAELPQDKWMLASYPDGLQRTNDNGEDLYMIVKKNLYGGPASGRNWGLLRNYTILSTFNNEDRRKELEYGMKRDQVKLSDKALGVIKGGKTKGWRVKQAVMDPCLFIFTSPEQRKCLAMIHTDDVDAIGESEEDLTFIFDIMHSIWQIKIVDSNYVLGVSRNITYNQDKEPCKVELTMTPYVKGMATVFLEHLPTGTINIPFPEKLTLNKDDTSEGEGKEVIKMGYQRAVGMILWAVRHVFIECKRGVSELCCVMSRPSHAAFKAAMHMIQYMNQRSHRGIQFNGKGNRIPVGMFDASNKAPKYDSKAHGGYCIHWMSGPVMSWSKKLQHIGHSSEHNEYMAMAAAIKAAIWLRQLLQECGFGEYVKEPTTLFGDNICANRLCKEHFVSTGNQYIYIPYHFNREARDLGLIEVLWVKSAMNLADIFTKHLSNQQLNNNEGGLLKYLLGYADVSDFKQMLEKAIDIDAMRKV